MAAIYAYLPLVKVYLTSKPYPLYGEEAVSEEHDVISGYGVYWHPETFIETMEVEDGDLYQTIWYYAYDAGMETLTEEMSVVSATLIQTIGYYQYEMEPETLNETMEVLSATLTEVIQYITIEQPADNVSEEFDIISGYSEPA